MLAGPSLLLNVSNPTHLDMRGLHASHPRRGTEIPRSELHVDKSGRRKVIDTRAFGLEICRIVHGLDGLIDQCVGDCYV